MSNDSRRRFLRIFFGASAAVAATATLLAVYLSAAVASFPTTGLIDNFNRADEGPQPSASWAQGPLDFTASDGLVVSSNQAARKATGSAYQDAIWNTATSSADSEVYGTVATVPSGSCGTPSITRDALLNGANGTGSSSSTTTLAVTTTATAAANTEIVIAESQIGTQTITVADNSGNGYTWAQIGSTSTAGLGGGSQTSFYGVYATAGLASGTVITLTYSSAVSFKWAGVVSYGGIASSSSTDVTAVRASSGETAWNGAAVTTTNANDLVIGMHNTGGNGEPSDTPGVGWTENHDFASGAQWNTTTMYQVASATGTYSPNGTWSTNQAGNSQTGNTISLKAAPGVTCGAVKLSARLASVGLGTTNGYQLQVVQNGANFDTWELDKLAAGVATINGATFTQAVAAGDQIGLQVTGSGTTTLNAWYKPAAGSWTNLFSRTDSSSPYTAAGKLGLGISGATIRVDDFSGGPTSTADFFVSSAGSDANPGTQASPFLTWNKCYAVAAAVATSPKTCEIALGTYSGQNLLTASRAGNALITFRPPIGSAQSAVYTPALNFGTQSSGTDVSASATYVRLTNITVGGDQVTPTFDPVVTNNSTADHITVDSSRVTRFEFFSGSNITVGPGNDIGSCKANAASVCLTRVLQATSKPLATNLVITGNDIHDIGSSNFSLYHPDGMACFGCVGVVISNNKWWNNAETNIRFQTQGSPANSSNVIEGNWFNFPWAGNSALGTYGTGQGGTPNNNCIDVDDNEPNLVLRFNSMGIRNGNPSCNLGTGNSTNTTLAGNIEGDAGACQSNVTHSFNIIYRFSSGNPSSACGTDSLQPWNTGINYTNTDLQNLLNFHLTGANGAADNFVPCGSVVGGCPATDIDGTARPVGANADAGSDER